MIPKLQPCLWFDGDAEDAARFYAATFPDSRVGDVMRAPADYPAGKKGDVITVECTIVGQPFLLLNGGPEFRFNEAVSFIVATADQAETDRLWHAITTNGGEESYCGWCKDRWGLSWQITPRVLMEYEKQGGEVAKRAFEAMMTMRKLDIAAIERAVAGG
jgi:predicted 3-demethylubiquinone-9 3-methyltransferase (glyoxalase superfamily)